MPVHIDTIDANVNVESRGQAEEPSSGGEAPSSNEQERWQQVERRARALAERTSAWGFDD
jgi:hypothetical protein